MHFTIPQVWKCVILGETKATARCVGKQAQVESHRDFSQNLTMNDSLYSSDEMRREAEV